MKRFLLVATLRGALFLPVTTYAATLSLEFPLNRVALQTNETVPVAVLRSDTAALAADTLSATITGEDGSKMDFTFPAPAVVLENGAAHATEHFNLDVRFLRPGNYTLQVGVNGATASAPFEVYSHVRRSTYKLINWGSPIGAANQRLQGDGEGGFGYNLMYDGPLSLTEYIRAGVDVVPVMVMGGAHQMDMRSEADWSDPYVTRGGTRRAARAGFHYRSFPNFIGVNFYDEPGLTWWADPATGKRTPHGIPAQVRAFESAWNQPAPDANKIDPAKAEDVKAWKKWGEWKLGFLDAAWHEAAYGVSQVRPDLISDTQSQYAWAAFTDGYYFNVTRSLPVASGHGGYDDLPGGYFSPSFYLTMARARDRVRPNWYLPTWYRTTTEDLMRVENYLCFAEGIQGIMTPPWIEPTGKTTIANAAIRETHQVMGRLGTIFDTMPATPRPLAMLYSLSNNLQAQTNDRSIIYGHGYKHGRNLIFGYLAGEITQYPIDAVVDEDVVDGTLADQHKAVLLVSIDYLDPKVVFALEQFAADGGLVLKTSDSQVQVKGAIDLGVTPALPDQAVVDSLTTEILAAPKKEWAKLQPYQTVSKYLEGTAPLAKALKAQLMKAGIKPVFETDQPEIVAQQHAAGDVEYTFAINTTNNRADQAKMTLLPVTATLTLPDAQRPIYDAMTGGKVPEFSAKDGQLSGTFQFGPGQMRVFARTTRPIGGVKVGTPEVVSDFTNTKNPISVSLGASFVDDKGKVLSGSVPLRVQVTDALSQTRYDLYRATSDGVLQLSLPLAANDPAGEWKVTVTELLSNQSDSAAFAYRPSPRNANILDQTRRAVMLDGEEANLFRFARANPDITIVPGTGDYHAAAERLQKILAPWGIRATIMDIAEAGKSRTLSEQEATTWIGLNPGISKPGDANPPTQSGFAVKGPTILLGTPADNAIIKMIQTEKFLPFVPKTGDFPGPGRGYVAWQRDAVGPGQESVTLIAQDAAGMDEAIGTFYEAIAGMQPLVPGGLPEQAKIIPANLVAPSPTPTPTPAPIATPAPAASPSAPAPKTP